MKHTAGVQLLIVLVALLLCGCNVLQQETIIKIGSEELSSWEVDNDNRLTVLLFPVESDIAPARNELRVLTVEYMYVDDDLFERVLDCFSERELLEAEAFKYITKTGRMNKIVTPALLTLFQLRPLFTLEDDNSVIMQNPYTGDDIRLTGVDYLKFKNTPLLPVPQL